ncbi:MAG: UDP-3-O-acyl-N-acetylglucosamine deacetylase [Holosporaceae bacterium]|jgi:UDP-3-O-[3-hydroxymyristoyl] N-acetylglucosamine deacetylase|nr:UDP-3-O-acyl-N-acetylglucosamine deacetylase [Holosporaceae bacterium]
MLQATVKSKVVIEGVGVHSGVGCRVSILPASENCGVVYVLGDTTETAAIGSCASDVGDSGGVRANYANVSDTTLCTRLGYGKVGVSMVEHLSAALYGCGVSNAVLCVCGGEVPILDGSAAVIVEKVLAAGVQWQRESRKKLKIIQTVKVEEEGRWAMLSPSDAFLLHMTCDFSSKGLTTQPFLHEFSSERFITEVAPARTFGFLTDREFYQRHALAQGVSPENTIIFDKNGLPLTRSQVTKALARSSSAFGIANDTVTEAATDLRFSDEPVRHKVLDAVGDLSLAECEIIGRYDGFCSGHRLNNLVLRKLFADSRNFLVT